MANSGIGALAALFAAVMLAGGSATALPVRMTLCGGGSAEAPGKAPANGAPANGAPANGCDLACHAGCQRRRRS